jgi:hypothetical protein
MTLQGAEGERLAPIVGANTGGEHGLLLSPRDDDTVNVQQIQSKVVALNETVYVDES